jgi:hypothetical protein
LSQVLKIDVAGIPQRWITVEEAASFYATHTVAWTLGDCFASLRGGMSRLTGTRSQIDIHPIIAIKGRSHGSGRISHSVPTLTRRKLIRRDRGLCAYCGLRFKDDELTTDHVIPVSKGGQHVWTNVLSACKGCNSAKGSREPHDWGHLPLFIAYTPNLYEGLILANRNVLADQMEFLLQGVGQQSRLKSQNQSQNGKPNDPPLAPRSAKRETGRHAPKRRH